MSQPDPTRQRDLLASELRRFRRAAGMTQRQAADAMDWSPSKILRVEDGSVSISIPDLQVLLKLYQVEWDTAAELIGLARRTLRAAD